MIIGFLLGAPLFRGPLIVSSYVLVEPYLAESGRLRPAREHTAGQPHRHLRVHGQEHPRSAAGEAGRLRRQV